MKAWQVGVTNVGATSAATMAWRSGGQLRVTVIVKSLFAFAPNDAMTQAPPEDILDADASTGDGPGSSIRAASDRYPFRPRADVVFCGHAYAPGGNPVKRLSARIAIAHGNEKSLDKVIDVVGDRSSPHADPVPFTKMPITYERAYGGPGFDANPAGVGFGPNARAMPNIVYPQGWQRDTEPASLGPIPAAWARRLRLSGNKPIDFLSKTVTDIPTDLDVSSFQCAPDDQRIAQLHGDEWVLLENLHPTHPRLMMRLPDVKGAAMVFGDDGVDIPIAMRPDTLLIDGDRGVCVLTCRGSHPIPNEAALDRLRIAAGVELHRTPIDWSDVKKKIASPANAAPGTAVLDPNTPIQFKAPYSIAEPRKAPIPATAATPLPGTPFAPMPAIAPVAPAHVPSPVGYSTVALSSPPQIPPDFDSLRAQSSSPPPDASNAAWADPHDGPEQPIAEASTANVPGVDDSASGSPAGTNEKKEWSWATSEPTDTSSQQKSAPRSRVAERPAEPPARAVIYGGFTRKK